jgi:GTP-binding protein LepA
MELVATIRNTYVETNHLGTETAVLKYRVPLSEIVIDFYDRLKSVSQGYASMSYEPAGVQEYDLVRLDTLVAGELVEPFSRIVPSEQAQYIGRAMVTKLKEVLPKQWFEVTLQAALGGKIIARETISALRKDVTGYLYGGDVTRKMKLLKKQAKGKKRMKAEGRVQIPHDVFLKMLKK